MSKYIKQKKNQTNKQVKPKLKILAQTNGEDFYLNEYDLAQMISNINVKQAQQEQQIKAILDAMSAATEGITTTSQPQQQELKLPKLNKVETAGLNDGRKFYGYGADEVKLES